MSSRKREQIVSLELEEISTPALIVDMPSFEFNLDLMAISLGDKLRPHVKAHKSSQIVSDQIKHGSTKFTAATLKEAIALTRVDGVKSVLLANETLNEVKLFELAGSGSIKEVEVIVAVDSAETIEVAKKAGISNVLIDVDVGLPRCGCNADDANDLAQLARSKGLNVKGVMGYEGHAVGLEDRQVRTSEVLKSMEILKRVHESVGGELISAGATGSFDINLAANDIQAGSYVFMDGAYSKLDLGFKQALYVLSTVISVSKSGWAVCDAGLKAFGMDHGNPFVEGFDLWFCSDEHTTFSSKSADGFPKVGDLVKMYPAHIDPTIAYHDQYFMINDNKVVSTYKIDMRGW